MVDLSCRRKGDKWVVAMNKWQTMTDMEVNRGMFNLHPVSSQNQSVVALSSVEIDTKADSIKMLEPYCSEFLVHAADNEGLQQGIDEDLVRNLAAWCDIPVTYAGGSRSVDDLHRVEELSRGNVDLTIGSALDIFGGSGVKLEDCIEWNKSKEKA